MGEVGDSVGDGRRDPDPPFGETCQIPIGNPQAGNPIAPTHQPPTRDLTPEQLYSLPDRALPPPAGRGGPHLPSASVAATHAGLRTVPGETDHGDGANQSARAGHPSRTVGFAPV